MTKKRENNSVDIAVIGGGIGGVYATFRLCKSAEKPTVRLFEATDRLGGRLKTFFLDPKLRFPLELGAMRYKRSHLFLNGLIEHFNLESAAFDTSECKYVLRGCKATTCDELIKDAYRVNEAEKAAASNKEAAAAFLIKWVITKTLSSLEFSLPAKKARELKETIRDHIERDELGKLDWPLIVNEGSIQYRAYGKITNIHLYDVGFWNLLQHFLSNEAILLIHDSLGYESIVSNWNAADAIPWFVADFERQQEWRVPCDGFENLINTIKSQIPKQREVIRMKHQLEGITPLADKSPYKWELEFRIGRRRATYRAKKVVLAVPKGSLEKLRVEDKGWSDIQRYYMPAVVPHKLFKFLLVYQNAWWKGMDLPGGDFGRVITDLPIRQVYYYGPEWIRAHAPQRLKDLTGDSWSIVMASYSDSHYVRFWSTFSSQNIPAVEAIGDKHFWKPTDWKKVSAENKRNLSQIMDKHGARWRMVMKIQSMLAELHSVKLEQIPQPIVGFFMDWGEEPYLGGWHTWEVHRRAGQVSEKMLQPFPGRGLHICGEAYSLEQGWIEGALKSTERVLVEKLNMELPEWWLGNEEQFSEYVRS